MNSNSYNATILVRDYLATTGDTLSARVCQTLGLPCGKHYIHDLRNRLMSLDSPKGVQNGNLSANEPIGSHFSTSAALKMVIMRLPDDTFTTNELRHLTNLSIGTVLKALRKLENEGVIQRVQSTRPLKWRRCTNIRPDFTKIFMEVHGLIDPISSVSQGQIAILANRALCGMPIDGIPISSLVNDLTSRYTRISLPTPPPRALEPFLLAVLKGAGDYRAVTRELEKVLREAKTIRRAFDRLARKDGPKSPLEDYALPTEWILIFEQPGRISSFVEAATVVLGSEFYLREAEIISEETIKITMEEMRRLGLVGQYAPLKKAVIDIAPSFHDHVLVILHDNIRKNVKMVDLPVRKFNIKELYRKVALEMILDKSEIIK